MKCNRLFGFVVAVTLAAMAGQAPTPPPKPEQHSTVPTADQQEIQALTNDITRMRTLLHQMEMNLALVQTSQSPLKHQFDLEIEMWNVTLDGMERRLQRLRGSASGVVLPGTVPLRQGSRQGIP